MYFVNTGLPPTNATDCMSRMEFAALSSTMKAYSTPGRAAASRAARFRASFTWNRPSAMTRTSWCSAAGPPAPPALRAAALSSR